MPLNAARGKSVIRFWRIAPHNPAVSVRCLVNDMIALSLYVITNARRISSKVFHRNNTTGLLLPVQLVLPALDQHRSDPFRPAHPAVLPTARKPLRKV